MTSTTLIRSALGMLFALLLPAVWAQAAPMVFVASTGVGASCTRAAPCATFSAALAVVDLGGTVTCLDSGPITDTGATTISSVTIDCAAVYRADRGELRRLCS